MAATYRTSAAGGSTSGTSNRTVAITPAVGDLLVVICAVAANSQNAPTCADNNGSGTYDLIGGTAITYDDGGTPIAHRLAVFVRTAKMVNTTSTTITVTTGSNTAGAVHVIAVSGMHRTGSSAVRQFASQTNQAAATTPAPAFSSAALTGNLTIGAVANNATGASMTTPTNWTERQDTGFSSDPVGLETVSRDSGFTGTTVTWGSTSATKFASFILELDGGPVTADGTAATDAWSGSSTTTSSTGTDGSAASDAWSASSTTTYIVTASGSAASFAWTAADGVGAALLEAANGTAAAFAWTAADGGELAFASGTAATHSLAASAADPSVASDGASTSTSWSASDGAGVALATGTAASCAWTAESGAVAVATDGVAASQSWTAEDAGEIALAVGAPAALTAAAGDAIAFVATDGAAATGAWVAFDAAASTATAGGPAELSWSTTNGEALLRTEGSGAGTMWTASDADVEVGAHGDAAALEWIAQSVPSEGEAEGTPASLTWLAVAASVAISVAGTAGGETWAAHDATVETFASGALATHAWSAEDGPSGDDTTTADGEPAVVTWNAHSTDSGASLIDNALPRCRVLIDEDD